MSVIFGGNFLTVQIGERIVRVPCHAAQDDAGNPQLVVELDDLSHWLAPHGDAEVSLTDLQTIAARIERACDERAIDVEFE